MQLSLVGSVVTVVLVVRVKLVALGRPVVQQEQAGSSGDGVGS